MAGIKDIARRAGTSVSAVSRALNRTGYVSEELRERIETAARELNYQPNAGARTLRSGRSNLIGVLVPTLEVDFFARLAHRLEQRLFAEGYQALICSTAEDAAHEGAYIRTLAAKQIDGLLVAVVGTDESGFELLMRRKVPVIAIDRHLTCTPSAAIASDHTMGGRLAAEHIIELGHRKVAIVGAPEHSEPIQLRVRGMTEAFRAGGLPVPQCHLGTDHSVAGCERLAAAVLAGPDRPTAIIATSDIAAIGAMRAAKALGLDIPGDLSITGHDDSPIATYVWPELTTVRQPVDQIAKGAVDMLLGRIRDGNEGPYEDVLLPVTFIPRTSTGPVR